MTALTACNCLTRNMRFQLGLRQVRTYSLAAARQSVLSYVLCRPIYCNVIVIDREEGTWGLECVMVELWMDGTWAVGCRGDV